MRWRLPLLISLMGVAACTTSQSRTAAPPASIQPAGPPPADPAALAGEVRRRLEEGMPITSRVQVDVDKSGFAMLTGFVNWDFERDQAVDIARRTPGVNGVAQDIRVMPIYMR